MYIDGRSRKKYIASKDSGTTLTMSTARLVLGTWKYSPDISYAEVRHCWHLSTERAQRRARLKYEAREKLRVMWMLAHQGTTNISNSSPKMKQNDVCYFPQAIEYWNSYGKNLHILIILCFYNEFTIKYIAWELCKWECSST